MNAKKYQAGIETAKTDHARGMTFDEMGRVPQASDNPDWVAGYRDQLAYFQDMESGVDRPTCQPVNNALMVKRVENFDGITCVIVECGDHDQFKRLPDTLNCESKLCGKSGWNSDLCEAYFRTDKKVGFKV